MRKLHSTTRPNITVGSVRPELTVRRAFTLVELLVVVAILALLLSLLMPSLSRAKELTRRAACRSQLHQWALGGTLYARANKNFFPYSNPMLNQLNKASNTVVNLNGFGIDTMYIVGWRMPVGIGVLIENGMVPDARLADCPSSTHPYMRYDRLDNGWTNRGYGGWPAPGKPGPTGHRECSYQYRATLGGSPFRPPAMDRDPGRTAFLADFWVYHCWHSENGILGLGTFMHRTQYETAYIDGSVEGIDDPNEWFINSSFSWYDWTLQETIWQNSFDQP